jgi:ribosomal protein L34
MVKRFSRATLLPSDFRSTRAFGTRLRAATIRGRLVVRTSGSIGLPPCDQIVECVDVWRKADDNPTDSAPKNNSVTHPHSPN